MSNQSLIQKIEALLLKEQAKLEEQLAAFAKQNIHDKDDYDATFPEYGDKEEDSASEVATYSDNLTLERTLESGLRDVKSTLKRLHEGTYGICKYCKKPIDERRLLARPTSSSCISCKKQLLQEI